MKTEYKSEEEFAALLKAGRIISKHPRGFAVSKDANGDDVAIMAWAGHLSMLGDEGQWHIYNEYKVRKFRDFPSDFEDWLIVKGLSDIFDNIIIEFVQKFMEGESEISPQMEKPRTNFSGLQACRALHHPPGCFKVRSWRTKCRYCGQRVIYYECSISKVFLNPRPYGGKHDCGRHFHPRKKSLPTRWDA